MKTAYIIRYVGMALLCNAAFMFICAIVGMCYGFDTGTAPLLLSFIITSIIGIFPRIFVPSNKSITSRDGYLIVLTSWLASCLMGMLPYLIWGGEFNIVDAWFESTSGFTTTGATILNNIEALPHSLLMWRSLTHWIGGVGVVLFTLVVLPSIGRQKMTLSSAELSTIAKDNFRYNTKKILHIIFIVYVGLTAAEAIALRIAGMNWFDAVAHSFSTLATGGFSTKNLSIMAYDSLAIETVITIFMLLAGVHFGLIYNTIRGKGQSLWNNEVSRFYFLTMLIGGGLIALNLYTNDVYDSVGDSIRYGLFQTVSYGTTTGFASANSAFWPPFSMLFLIVVSIQCAMAGSTTGGIKSDRMLLLFKSIKHRILKIQHPNAVMTTRLGGRPQDIKTIQFALVLVVFYLLALFFSTVFLTFFDIDLLTAFTASVASIGNVGPGFGEISNLNNMDFFNPTVKIWLTIMMLFGRLELFGLIHLFTIRSWR
ncbi:MAG: TrkH family potassium uptake protein [Rikenellaceae bacterium]